MALRVRALLWLCVVHGLVADPDMTLSGDTASWYTMFESGKLTLLAAEEEGLEWTEGPVWTEQGLLFSDVITGKMWRWSEESQGVEEFLASAGGCPESGDMGSHPWTCDPEQAEPGSNGMAVMGHGLVAVCQHGARRLAQLDMTTKSMTPLASVFEGKRLNGPNDVVVHSSGDLIFTDPPYAFLQKSRFYDHNYLDAKSDQGFSGIYRLSRTGKLKLLHTSMARPNGLAVISGSPQKLIVAECCQGHAPTCPQGMARWNVFELDDKLETLQFAFVVERREDESFMGCADGLTVHPRSGLVVSSCPQGICVIDLEKKSVTVRLHVGVKVSNVAFGGGYMWVTGEKRLWRIPLAAADAGKDEL